MIPRPSPVMAATSGTWLVLTTAYAARMPGSDTAAASSDELRKSRRFILVLRCSKDGRFRTTSGVLAPWIVWVSCPVGLVARDRTPSAGIDARRHRAHGDAAFHRADTDTQVASDTLGVDHLRSEERRVGKECRSRWSRYQ